MVGIEKEKALNDGTKRDRHNQADGGSNIGRGPNSRVWATCLLRCVGIENVEPDVA
ncbi:unnamed protein product, partial [Nesidiocoris tenuis]